MFLLTTFVVFDLPNFVLGFLCKLENAYAACENIKILRRMRWPRGQG